VLHLDLTKTLELNLTKAGITPPTMATKLAVDCSGSMDDEFNNGWVGKTVNLAIAAALKFDDNGELDVGFFNTSFKKAPSATVEDIGNYMKTKGSRFRAGGGTSFAPIISECESVTGNTFTRLFSSKKSSAPLAYTMVITDGDPGDGYEFEKVLDDTSGRTFYQFIAIGNQVNTRYLTNIAAAYSHMGFNHLPDPHKVTPDSFYETLCNKKFADWCEKVKV